MCCVKQAKGTSISGTCEGHDGLFVYDGAPKATLEFPPLLHPGDLAEIISLQIQSNAEILKEVRRDPPSATKGWNHPFLHSRLPLGAGVLTVCLLQFQDASEPSAASRVEVEAEATQAASREFR